MRSSGLPLRVVRRKFFGRALRIFKGLCKLCLCIFVVVHVVSLTQGTQYNEAGTRITQYNETSTRITQYNETGTRITQYNEAGTRGGPCTMIMSGFSREKLMTALLLHYATMPLFDKIFVSWANTVKPNFLIELKRRLPGMEHIHIIYTDDSLNLRFEPPKGLTTDCVFIVDDDMYVRNSTIISMYQLWSSHSKQIVGLWPRAHKISNFFGFRRYRYKGRPSVGFSMVLTKFMVLHRRYLTMYTEESSREIRDYVDSVQNCEDIAMNFLVSAATRLPPLYVRDEEKVDFGGKLGIYTRNGHASSRNDCVSDIYRMLGSIEPKTSSVSYSVRELKESPFEEDSFRALDLHSITIDLMILRSDSILEVTKFLSLYVDSSA